mgnify:CR=1 FL=1
MAAQNTIRWDRFGNPFDTYNNLDSMAAEVDANIQRREKREQDAEAKKLRNLELGAIKAKNIKSLMIPSDTQFQGLNEYAQGISRNLVDNYSSLVSQLEKGQIDTNYFAKESAKIQSQVPQVKTMITGIEDLAGKYAAGLAQGTLSMANSPEHEQFFQAVINNKGKFGMDDNNVLTYFGKTADGEDFSIPANGLDKMPQPLEKVVSFVELTNPIISNLQKPRAQMINGREVMQSVPLGSKLYQQSIDAGFDAFLKEKGNDGLRSLAADHAGYTREQIEKDLNTGFYEAPNGETYTSKLEYDMDQLYQQTAQDNYVNQELVAHKQRAYDLQLKQLEQRNIQAANQMYQMRTETERFNYGQAKTLEKYPAPTRENLTSWGGLDPKGKRKVVKVNKGDSYGDGYKAKEDMFFIVQGDDGKVIPNEIIDGDPNVLAKWLSTGIFGIPEHYTNFQYKLKESPLKKLSNFFTGKK